MKISDRSMLMRFHRRVWEARTQDKQLTREVTDQCQADTGQLTVVKKLMPKDFFKPVTDIADEAYYEARRWTRSVPGMKGVYELPVKHFTQVDRILHDLAARFELEVQKLWALYPAAYADGPRRLGTAWDPSRLPDPGDRDSFCGRFALGVRYLPYPEASSLPTTLDGEDRLKIEKQMEEQAQGDMKAGERELIERLKAPVQHLVNRLKALQEEPEEGAKRPRFYDSVLENIQEIVEVAPGLNLLEKPEISAAITQIQEKLLAKTTEQLKQDGLARRDVLAEAEKISSNLEGLL